MSKSRKFFTHRNGSRSTVVHLPDGYYCHIAVTTLRASGLVVTHSFNGWLVRIRTTLLPFFFVAQKRETQAKYWKYKETRKRMTQ